jgi:hypothetical protein
MKWVSILGAGMALAIASTAAGAFQEQSGGGAPPAQTPAAEAPAQDSKATELSTQGDAMKGTGGTEVRIPGLGKLGVLPKMDFGLELLYGASEVNKPAAEEERELPADDLTIRGTVKHSF